MRHTLPLAIAVVLAGAGTALADDDDCSRPMGEWQSREAVAAHAVELGITAERLRIDDGCYEIRGRDGAGNRVELKLDPATLALLELDVRFQPEADPSRYLPGARGQSGTAPQAGGN
jgi:hypothetical protein